MGTKNINFSNIELKRIIKNLQFGQLSLIGRALTGSNATFLAELLTPELTIQAIYKPSNGERPLWDFPDFTLAQREVAAFIVSFLLKWNLVPPTIFRSQPAIYGKGSLQLFIEHDPAIHYLNAKNVDNTEIMKIILFDILINNADRKSGHVIFDSQNKPWLIDHGLCFNQDYKYRTVIWDFSGELIPEERLKEISQFLHLLNKKNIRLVSKLNMLLSKVEIKSILERGQRLINSGKFPYPEPNRRSYPWPPI